MSNKYFHHQSFYFAMREKQEIVKGFNLPLSSRLKFTETVVIIKHIAELSVPLENIKQTYSPHIYT